MSCWPIHSIIRLNTLFLLPNRSPSAASAASPASVISTVIGWDGLDSDNFLIAISISYSGVCGHAIILS